MIQVVESAHPCRFDFKILFGVVKVRMFV